MNHAIARINYKRMSGWYDLFARSEKRFNKIGLQILNILPGEKALEIGFGTGQSLIAFAKSTGETGHVYGLSISEGMLRVSNQRILRAGLAGRVDLRLGVATKLPFENAFFDVIFISFTLELFDLSEIPLFLGECKRVLVNDGRLCVVALAKEESQAVRIYEWFHDHLAVLVDCRPIFLQNSIEAAAFTPLKVVETAIWGLPVEVVLARKNE